MMKMQSIMTAGTSRNGFVSGSDGPVIALTLKREDGSTVELTGREAFAMHALVTRGEEGVTPLDWIGPRWSDYTLKLRRRGFVIETVNESHRGAYPGRHGRYVLRSPVTVVDVQTKGVR
jgi:hypothetical protein